MDVPRYSIRTDRWCYVEWGEQGDIGIELYDQRLDPKVVSSLALSKDHSEVIESLRKKVGKNWPVQ